MTRGRRGSLPLRRRALSSPSPCRFIPAHPKSGRNRHGLHRPGISLAKRLDQVVQRTAARRVSERSALRDPVRSPAPSRGLEDRLRHEPTSQRARLAHPGRVRRGLAQSTTASARIASGSANGFPSRRVPTARSSLGPAARADAGVAVPQPPQGGHGRTSGMNGGFT